MTVREIIRFRGANLHDHLIFYLTVDACFLQSSQVRYHILLRQFAFTWKVCVEIFILHVSCFVDCFLFKHHFGYCHRHHYSCRCYSLFLPPIFDLRLSAGFKIIGGHDISISLTQNCKYIVLYITILHLCIEITSLMNL